MYAFTLRVTNAENVSRLQVWASPKVEILMAEDRTDLTGVEAVGRAVPSSGVPGEVPLVVA